jgi:hypothetical protein
VYANSTTPAKCGREDSNLQNRRSRRRAYAGSATSTYPITFSLSKYPSPHATGAQSTAFRRAVSPAPLAMNPARFELAASTFGGSRSNSVELRARKEEAGRLELPTEWLPLRRLERRPSSSRIASTNDEGGIRTRVGVTRNALAERRLKPLGHLTKAERAGFEPARDRARHVSNVLPYR